MHSCQFLDDFAVSLLHKFVLDSKKGLNLSVVIALCKEMRLDMISNKLLTFIAFVGMCATQLSAQMEAKMGKIKDGKLTNLKELAKCKKVTFADSKDLVDSKLLKDLKYCTDLNLNHSKNKRHQVSSVFAQSDNSRPW